jgi:hypothetical protein
MIFLAMAPVRARRCAPISAAYLKDSRERRREDRLSDVVEDQRGSAIVEERETMQYRHPLKVHLPPVSQRVSLEPSPCVGMTIVRKILTV